jgi:hypothetical protein
MEETERSGIYDGSYGQTHNYGSTASLTGEHLILPILFMFEQQIIV